MNEEHSDKKPKDTKKLIINIVICVCAAVLAVSLFFIGKYYWDSYHNRLSNNSLKEIHSSAPVSSQTSEPDTTHGLKALIAQNADTKGWITIPGTNIDYPVVQAKDNEKYLKHDFYGKDNRDGAIFMDYRCKTDPFSTSTIIYGHNMKDGQMFAELEKYERRSDNDYISFYNKNPLIKLETLKGENVFKIFAVLVTASSEKYKGALYYLDTDFSSDTEFDKFIEDVNKRSFIKTDIEVKPTDKIITLSTCDYVYPASPDNDHARLVVMGRLLRDGESESITPAKKNDNITFPDFYYTEWKKK